MSSFQMMSCTGSKAANARELVEEPEAQRQGDELHRLLEHRRHEQP